MIISGGTFPGYVHPVGFEFKDGYSSRPIEFFYFLDVAVFPVLLPGDDEKVKKPAPTEFPILPLLAERWSPTAFSSSAIEKDKLERLFEAARWAPSCSNEQPWIFVIAHHGTDGFNRMADCLEEGNSWARNAAALVLSVARMTFARNGKPNRHGMYDTGAAVANLLVQAQSEGLFTHQMAGYDVEKARTMLQIPENDEPCAMMAIGYYGDHDSLPEKQRLREESPRQRKPKNDFIFVDTMLVKE